MRIQTIHTNKFGKVLNESSATGFLITDDQGRKLEAHAENGRVMLQVDGTTFNIEYLCDIAYTLRRKVPTNAPDRPAT